MSEANVRTHGSEKDLEARYGIPRKTSQKWRWSKEGPPYRKVGTRVLYKFAEVEAWLDAQTVDPKVEPNR